MSKNQLHRNQLEDFQTYLENEGFEVIDRKNYAYQVIGWRPKKQKGTKGALPLIFDGKSPEHFTANKAAEKDVRKFHNWKKKNS